MQAVHLKGVQELEKNIILYDLGDFGKFRAYIPGNETIEKITEIRDSKGIHIGISRKMSQDESFLKSEHVFCLMFKIITNVLPEKTIRKLSQGNQFWNFSIPIYPLWSSLTKEQKEKLAPIKYAEIWVTLPINTSLVTAYPPLKHIVRAKEEDEQRIEKNTTKWEPGSLKKGQTMIMWAKGDINIENHFYFMAETRASHDNEELSKQMGKHEERTSSWNKRNLIMTLILFIITLLVSILL